MPKSFFERGFSSLLLVLFIASLILFSYFVSEGKINRNLFSRLGGFYCNVPIKISLGEVDPRFKISKDTIEREIDEASSIWEEETGKDLFVFEGKHKSTITVNFVYDERQKEAIASKQALDLLKNGWSRYESLVMAREKSGLEYDAYKIRYETSVRNYNQKLKAYEDRVREWNRKQGTREEYEALTREEKAVDAAYAALERERIELNNMATRINNSNSEIQTLYSSLSTETNKYNSIYSSDDEITVGEYNGNFTINIYQFTDLNQLRVTLAHELGHSLGLDHTENEKSIMFFLQSAQDGSSLYLTDEDKVELEKVCEFKT